MQTLVNNAQLIYPLSTSEFYTVSDRERQLNVSSPENKLLCLKAVYRQLFKENRDIESHHNATLDSEYLNSQLTTKELVRELLCSDMYVNYVLSVNSNFRFVALCFERVLGRLATQKEIHVWSSLLASEGLSSFAKNLVDCDEYMAAFGEDTVPFRRSQKLSPSNQGLPALPKELSIKRYQGPGNVSQLIGIISPFWKGNQPPIYLRKLGAVLAVAGTIELVRIIVTLAWLAYSTGGF